MRSKVEAIRFENDEPLVVESLCVGCGICIKKCPFNALSIVNLPDELEEECSHRFGSNTFKLFRFPAPSPGIVLGLLGQNGTGKTTTIAKVAQFLRSNGFSVVLAGSDTYRAGSIEQLEEHARRLSLRLIKHNYGADPENDMLSITLRQIIWIILFFMLAYINFKWKIGNFQSNSHYIYMLCIILGMIQAIMLLGYIYGNSIYINLSALLRINFYINLIFMGMSLFATLYITMGTIFAEEKFVSNEGKKWKNNKE